MLLFCFLYKKLFCNLPRLVLRRISVIVVSADGGIINQFRFALAEVLRVELGEGEVGVAVQGHVGAEAVLVHQLWDELGREGDDEGLENKLSCYICYRCFISS